MLRALPNAEPPTAAAVIDVLSHISYCANQQEIASLNTYFSDFGRAWVLESSGKFFVDDSPMAAMTSDGSFSRTVGSLPLQVYSMLQLSDGRVVALIGDGSLRNSDYRRTTNPAEGSVWVFAPISGDWKVDAIIGGIKGFGDTWTTVPIGDGS